MTSVVSAASAPFFVSGMYTIPGARLYEIATGRETARFEPPTGDYGTDSLALTASGDLLAVGCYTWKPDLREVIQIWDLGTRQLTAEFARSESPNVHIKALTFSPSGDRLAAGRSVYGGRLEFLFEVWDWRAGRCLQGTTAPSHRVATVTFDSEGKKMLAAYTDGAIATWSTESSRLMAYLEAPNQGECLGMVTSPAGNTVALTLQSRSDPPPDHWTVFMRDLVAGEWTEVLDTTEGPVDSLALSPDGRTLAVACSVVGDKPYAFREAEVLLVDTGTLGVVSAIPGWTNRVVAMDFSPDGRYLAGTSGELRSPRRYTARTDGVGGELKVWDLTTGQVTLTRPADSLPGMTACVFSNDGRYVATADYEAVRVQDAASGETKCTFSASELPVVALASSPDGRTLATGAWDRTVGLWDVESGQKTGSLVDQTDRLSAVVFSPDGRALVAGSYDGTLKLWDWREERHVATLTRVPSWDSTGPVSGPLWLVLTPQGYYDCAEGAEYAVHWRMAGNALVPFYHFEETFRRPDLVRKALAGARLEEQVLLFERIPPACRFLQPEDGSTVEGNSVRVLIEGTDDLEVTDLRLCVNGVPVPESTARPIIAEAKPIVAEARPIVAEAKPYPDSHAVSRLFTMDVPLPQGEQDVTVRATVYDDERNRADAVIELHRAGVSPAMGDLYVLCVGVSEYRNPKYNLGCAARDAEALAGLLANQEGRQYAATHVTLLTDEDARVAQVQQALASLQDAKSGDTVVVFMSGHGVHTAGGFYFAPHSLFVNDIPGTCLNWQDVVDCLSSIYCRKLLFADACHSGGALGSHQATNEQIADLTRHSGIVVLASSRGDEFSYEKAEQGHGAFTLALLEALTGRADVNGDGAITLPELVLYVPERVTELTDGLQHPHLVTLQDLNPQKPLVRTK